jgi:hypothetical protein
MPIISICLSLFSLAGTLLALLAVQSPALGRALESLSQPSTRPQSADFGVAALVAATSVGVTMVLVAIAMVAIIAMPALSIVFCSLVLSKKGRLGPMLGHGSTR